MVKEYWEKEKLYSMGKKDPQSIRGGYPWELQWIIFAVLIICEFGPPEQLQDVLISQFKAMSN